jgi:hypothetical protein
VVNIDGRMIAVKCDTEKTIDWHELKEFQGELKARTKDDIAKAKKSILKHGFSFPFAVRTENDNGFISFPTGSIVGGQGLKRLLLKLRESRFLR